MRTILKIILTTFIFGVLSLSAHAANISRTVSSGKTSLIFTFYIYDADRCSGMAYAKPNLKQPKHGRLSWKRTPFRVKKGQRCQGAKVQAVSVYYTSKKGYHGRDIGKFGFQYPRYVDGYGDAFYNLKATITVK